MGAGKTTVGRFLARELKRDFYDSDQIIEERTGVDIAWIFDVEGEEGFRHREMAIIDELTQLNNVVIATGGGVVVTTENRRYLASRGIVVYLCTNIQYQLERTEKDKKRPLLHTSDPTTRLKELADERDSLYREIADYVFTTDERSVKMVASDVLNKLIHSET